MDSVQSETSRVVVEEAMTAGSREIHRIGLGRYREQQGGIRRLYRVPISGFVRYAACFLLVAAVAVTAARASEQAAKPLNPALASVEDAIVLTQLPVADLFGNRESVAGGMLRSRYGEGARLIVLRPDGATKILSEGFHSASDPEVSFDGARILFAGKKGTSDRWNIFEMNVDGSGVRQITHSLSDCRSPSYQSTLYTIVSAAPWYQLTFVSSTPGAVNECGLGILTNLYSCKLDGTAVRQLTFNLSSDLDPYLMPDGRLVFASWQRARLNHGPSGRVGLFGVNIDGADCAAFCTEEGRRIKHMPCVTTKGLVVFVQANELPWHGGGALGSVTTRRPLHSYRPVTRADQGWFHSPSPLPDGRILVSHLPTGGGGTFGLGVLDPETGRFDPVFDDPQWHDVHAKVIRARPEPDGRSSVVSEEDANGKLYCLSVYTNDLKWEWLPRGSVKRLRVLEGIAVRGESRIGSSADGSGCRGIPALAQRRILGEVPIAPDGSFNLEVPANTPIELQILDDKGMALRRCGWIWAKNHEPRGCIGCHEDGELTPENILAGALTRPSVKLTLPTERRRTVDFRRDVMPIIAGKCAQCHADWDSPVRLTAELAPASSEGRASPFNRSYESLLDGAQNGKGRYVHCGQARTSPLIWTLYGRNTSRLWDGIAAAGQSVGKMPPDTSPALSEEEKRTFIEWIDLGGLWDGIPAPVNPSADKGGGGQ